MTQAHTVLHVDMDAFYASVEERERPELKGQPVVVGGTPEGRGVVAAANYAAREFGVRSAMPAGRARMLCPQAVFIRPRMDLYAEVSGRIREIFRRYTPLVEPLSLDEAFLDVSASRSLFGAGHEIAARIKQDILEELSLVASVGVAPNKFLAKLAGALEKPDGLVVVDPDHVQEFLDPLPVERLWGVGTVAAERLWSMGVYTIADLRRQTEATMTDRFGKWGTHLWELAHGRDSRTVTPDSEARSISHETTFEVDIADRSVLRSWLLVLTEQVGRRLRRCDLRAHTVEIKVRYADFRTVNRSHTLTAPTSVTPELWASAVRLLERQLRLRGDPVRLLGMGTSNLTDESARQPDLFAETAETKHREVDGVLDQISERFGQRALRRGGGARRQSGPADPADKSDPSRRSGNSGG